MVLKLNGLDPSYGSDIQNVFPYGWSLVKVTVRTVCIFKPFINELFTVWLAGFFRYCRVWIWLGTKLDLVNVTRILKSFSN